MNQPLQRLTDTATTETPDISEMVEVYRCGDEWKTVHTVYFRPRDQKHFLHFRAYGAGDAWDALEPPEG